MEKLFQATLIDADVLQIIISNLEEVAEDIFRVRLSTDLIQITVSGLTLFGRRHPRGQVV